MSPKASFIIAVLTAAVNAGPSVALAEGTDAAMHGPGDVFAPVEASAGAWAEPVVDTNEVFPAAYVEDFDVDGDMGKPVWGTAKRVPELWDRGGNAAMQCKSDIRILYSRTALYIGATLWQDMSQMVCKWDQHDMPVWDDDNIEIFLFVHGPDGARLCQFVLNPINSMADMCDGDKSFWVRGCAHATKRFADRWTLELRLPFDGIPAMGRPVVGDFVGIRFCRTVHAPTTEAGASPSLLSPGHSQRARFAKLLFARPGGPNAERLAAEGEEYRRDALRKRFYARFFEEKARFEEIRGCAASFAQSDHSIHKLALAGLRQMKSALDVFMKRFSDDVSAEREIPQADADAILAQFAGFRAFASKHAYIVWRTDPWERGSPRDMPPPDAPPMPPAIAFEQAGNEREVVCLNVAGVLCGPRLDIRLHPQSVKRTKTHGYLSTDKFEICTEPFIRFGAETITAPHVRSPGNIVTVSPGRTERVWVALDSRGVEAGEYDTRLSFKSAADLRVADRDLPVAVRVWNFALPETRDWPIKAFSWGPVSFAEDEVSLLELAHSYHITHGWTQQYRYKYGLYDDMGFYRRPDRGMGEVVEDHDFDDALALHGNEGFLRRAKDLGMRFVVGWGTPMSVEWFKAFSGRLVDMGFGYDDFVFHGLLRDEFSRADIPKAAARREAVLSWNPNLNFLATYLSTPPPTGATMDDIEAAGLPEFFKNWAVIDGRCRDPEKGPETISRLRARGCRVWTYRCLQFMTRLPILGYYRFYPWEAYMRGLDGFAFWTVYDPKGDDGWDSRDGYDEGLCWRGLDKKPVPTKMLEAVREGLEDVAYMDRLKAELERHKAAGREFPQYEELLAVREAVVKSDDQGKVDEWRLAVGRAVDSLCRNGK